jgi:exoribonuclease R
MLPYSQFEAFTSPARRISDNIIQLSVILMIQVTTYKSAIMDDKTVQVGSDQIEEETQGLEKSMRPLFNFFGPCLRGVLRH